MSTDLRHELLVALRDHARTEGRSSVIVPLDLSAIADRSGASVNAVRNALSDLLAEGFAEPYMTSFGDHAEEGHCRITTRGMTELTRAGQ